MRRRRDLHRSTLRRRRLDVNRRSAIRRPIRRRSRLNRRPIRWRSRLNRRPIRRRSRLHRNRRPAIRRPIRRSRPDRSSICRRIPILHCRPRACSHTITVEVARLLLQNHPAARSRIIPGILDQVRRSPPPVHARIRLDAHGHRAHLYSRVAVNQRGWRRGGRERTAAAHRSHHRKQQREHRRDSAAPEPSVLLCPSSALIASDTHRSPRFDQVEQHECQADPVETQWEPRRDPLGTHGIRFKGPCGSFPRGPEVPYALEGRGGAARACWVRSGRPRWCRSRGSSG